MLCKSRSLGPGSAFHPEWQRGSAGGLLSQLLTWPRPWGPASDSHFLVSAWPQAVLHSGPLHMHHVAWLTLGTRDSTTLTVELGASHQLGAGTSLGPPGTGLMSNGSHCPPSLRWLRSPRGRPVTPMWRGLKSRPCEKGFCLGVECGLLGWTPASDTSPAFRAEAGAAPACEWGSGVPLVFVYEHIHTMSSRGGRAVSLVHGACPSSCAVRYSLYTISFLLSFI